MNKETIKAYIEKKKEVERLEDEACWLLCNNLKNEKYHQLKKDAATAKEELNTMAKKFIESFILE